MLNAKAIFSTAVAFVLFSSAIDMFFNNPLFYYDLTLYCLGLVSFWDYRSMAIAGKISPIKYGSGVRRVIDSERDKAEFEKMMASRYIGGFIIMGLALALEVYGFHAK